MTWKLREVIMVLLFWLVYVVLIVNVDGVIFGDSWNAISAMIQMRSVAERLLH